MIESVVWCCSGRNIAGSSDGPTLLLSSRPCKFHTLSLLFLPSGNPSTHFLHWDVLFTLTLTRYCCQLGYNVLVVVW